MIEACVVDASVGIKLFILEADSPAADMLFSSLAAEPPARFYVPDLFYAECANVLWKYVRHYGYPIKNAYRDLTSLQNLDLLTVSSADLLAPAMKLALAHDISIYDACYAALAYQLKFPLVSADRSLKRNLLGSEIQFLELSEL